MEPKFVDFPGASVIGLGKAYSHHNGPLEIPGLWKEFAGYCKSHALSLRRSFGLCLDEHPAIPKGTGDDFVYVAAIPASGDQAPNAVQYKILPGRYAVFTHRGSIADFPKTLQAVWQEWLPANQDIYRPAAAFEYYDERFDPATNAGEVDIYVPVK